MPATIVSTDDPQPIPTNTITSCWGSDVDSYCIPPAKHGLDGDVVGIGPCLTQAHAERRRRGSVSARRTVSQPTSGIPEELDSCHSALVELLSDALVGGAMSFGPLCWRKRPGASVARDEFAGVGGVGAARGDARVG